MNEDRHLAIEAARLALRDHPGRDRQWDLESLWISIGQVMRPNLAELLGLLRQPSTDDNLFAELIQNVRPPIVR